MDNQLRQINSPQIELYERIQAFSLDQLDAQLSFSKRLARDNNWSLSYAQRVIEEYKKFTFLAVVAGHPVTPSDQVDQVWHLHLSYTQSYWQDFCPNILQTPLHHDPTRGGSSEHLKFNDWYSQTLDSYQQFFGQIPPADIWSAPQDRFGRDLHFVRVNTQQNWLLPKPSLSSLPKVQPKQALIFSLLCTFASVVTGCQILGGVPNPAKFTGAEFLTFYFFLSLAVIVAARNLRWYLRLPSKNLASTSPSLDIYETAYLAGGKKRVMGTAITSLVQREYINVKGTQISLTLNSIGETLLHPVEQAVMEAISSDISTYKVLRTIIPKITGIRDRLRHLGLFLIPSQSFKARLHPALLTASLVGLGTARILTGISSGKPVGNLIIMCFIVAIISLGFLLVSLPDRSRYGDQFLKRLLRQHQHYISSINQKDAKLPLLFALVGAGVLSSSVFPELMGLLMPVSSSGGGASWGGGDSSGDGGDSGASWGGGDSSGDGGDSGGGGGCGGCGGGDG